jgi:cytochrome c oxidase assembly protein subunit 15
LITIKPTEVKVKILAYAQVLLTFVVIIIGTLVTGSGPHAGDLKAPRLKLDERAITWLHADAVIALLGVSLALLVLSEISPETKRRVKIFFAVTLAQGLIGYIQYVLGLPELLVIVHVLGSTLVWIASWRIWLSITTATRT